MSKYNSLLSYSIGKPAIKKGATTPKTSFVKFDPSLHEFLGGGRVRGEYTRNNDFTRLKDLAHLVQFITKYWDISKCPTVNLLWVRRENEALPSPELFENFKTFFPLVSLSVMSDNEKFEEVVDNLFLFWDTEKKLEDELLSRLSPVFLQIAMDDNTITKYGEIFWDGRIYFNIGDNGVRLVTGRLGRKIKYSADIFQLAKNLRPQGNFYNIFTVGVKYCSLSMLGFKNDWESSLLAHIFREFLEKTMVDVDSVVSEDDVYHILRIKSEKTKVKKSMD